MMKRILSILIFVLLVTTMIPATAFADETITGTCGGGTVTYTFDGECLSLEGMEGEDNRIGYDDWEAIYYALSSKVIKRLYIDKNIGLMTIGSYFTKVMRSLEEISVEEGNQIYSVMDEALVVITTEFGGKEEKSLVLYPRRNGVEEYTVPNGVTVIDRGAFEDNESIKKIKIPESVEWIGYLLDGCLVEFLGENEGTPRLEGDWFGINSNIQMSCKKYNEQVQNWLSVVLEQQDLFLKHTFNESGTCQNCGATRDSLEPHNGKNLVKCPINKDKLQYFIFDTETQEIKGVSYYEEPITEIDVPDQIDGKDIKGFHFSDTSIDRGDGVIFPRWRDLQRINLKEGLTKVYCNLIGTQVSELIIPDTAENICLDESFHSDFTSPLKRVTLPISTKLTEIGTTDCLTEYVLSKGTGKGYDYDSTTHKSTSWYRNRAKDLTIDFKEGITYIGSYTFAELPHVSEYEIPASVEEIGNNAFFRNEGLTNVVLKEGLKEVGYQSFAENENLTNVILPASLTDIKYNSFDGCPNLVLTVTENSAGHKFAKKNGISYRIGADGEVVNPPADTDKPSGGTGGGGDTIIIGGGSSDAQTPTIGTGNGAYITMSKDGRTATISIEKGYELSDVVLNGVSLGKVTVVKNLKTGDKLSVLTVPKTSKNDRLKNGVQDTEIKLSYKMSEIGKGWIKVRYKKSLGYKVDYYEIYRAENKKTNFSDTPFYTTTTNKISGSYKNTKAIKKGIRYYYKMRGVREIDGETVYTQWSNTVMRTGR